MTGLKQRSRSGRKHNNPKNTAFLDFEKEVNELASDATYEYKKLFNPHICEKNGRQYACVDIEWETSREYLNCVSGNLDEIRHTMDEEDKTKLDAIMRNDAIRDSFEATRNAEDNEKQNDQ